MNEILSKNFYTVHGWMITELELSGTELILFAVIFGFTQDGMCKFCGGVKYFANWTDLSENTVRNGLQSLVKKNLIIRESVRPSLQSGVEFISYYANCDLVNNVEKNGDFFSRNFYVTHGWMRTELKLSKAELVLYAIIYGFSQDGSGVFVGSISYLAKWANTTDRTIQTCMKSLIEKGLVIRGYTEERYNYYKVNRDILCEKNLLKK